LALGGACLHPRQGLEDAGFSRIEGLGFHPLAPRRPHLQRQDGQQKKAEREKCGQEHDGHQQGHTLTLGLDSQHWLTSWL